MYVFFLNRLGIYKNFLGGVFFLLVDLWGKVMLQKFVLLFLLKKEFGFFCYEGLYNWENFLVLSEIGLELVKM